jgi:CBS domain-containing protein
MSAFRAPEKSGFDSALVRSFPNITDVDMTSTINQVQAVLDKVIRAVEFLFGFTLAAGLVVLFAAVTATREERAREFAIMRAVGARGLAAAAGAARGAGRRRPAGGVPGQRRGGGRGLGAGEVRVRLRLDGVAAGAAGWARWPAPRWRWRPAGGDCATCCSARWWRRCGGPITGLTRYFRTVQPALFFVLADPAGSVVAEYTRSGTIGEAGSWAVEGIGEDFIPAIADLSGVKKAYSISDEESFGAARELLRAEAILGGSSTGTLLAAALRFCREQTKPLRVMTFVCDTGTRYLSKVYNDQWMLDQGLLARQRFGDLRDVVSRRFEDGSVISVGPGDTLLTAFQRMRLADVSQLPVLDEDGRLIGVIDESDLLLGVHADADRFHSEVRSAMTDVPETLPPSASLGELEAVLDRGLVAMIADEAGFHGLITRVDLLNHLRRSLK